LAETKSFTLAAKRNGVTQSAVTQRLDFWEQQFEIKLVERGFKKFRLTPAGEIVSEYAGKITQIHDAFIPRWEELLRNISQTIRISTTPYVGLYHLPPLIKQFQKNHPQAQIQVEIRGDERIREDVLDYRVDLGLRVTHPAHEPGIEIIPIRKEPLVLICHPQHPFAQHNKIRIGAFKRYTWMSFEQGYPDHLELVRILRKCRVEPQRIIKFNHIEPIKRLVALGEGVAIVPEVTVREEVADRSLAALSIANGDFYHPLLGIRKRNARCIPVLKEFIAFLKEAPKSSAVERLRSPSRPILQTPRRSMLRG
jgi:DNA-binding transcriptional LysR family regulator